MPYVLRDYQVDAVVATMRASGRPVIVLPTGAGKSAVMATYIVGEYNEKRSTLLVTHRKELVEQDRNAIRVQDPYAEVGIYSASIGLRQVRRITVANVQSVYNKIDKLFPAGIDNLVVDECHMIPSGDDGIYNKMITALLAKNPKMKIVGFTATNWRMDGGLLTVGRGKLFTHIGYEVQISSLVEKGYLVPLVTPSTAATYDTSSLEKGSNGDFKTEQMQTSIEGQGSVTQAAIFEAIAAVKADNRRHTLVFCSSVKHAEEAVSILKSKGETVELITGETPQIMRSSTISRFRNGQTPWLVGIDVLTTGFDAPCVDSIVILRPTQSSGLYVQILGRGTRTSEGKTDCLVLDYGGNVDRHGPIEEISGKIKSRAVDTANKSETSPRVCANCLAEVKRGLVECPECGKPMPSLPRSSKHDEKAAKGRDIIAGYKADDWIPLSFMRAAPWVKEGRPTSVCVTFQLQGSGRSIKQWIHPGGEAYMRSEFCRWWRSMGGIEPPTNADVVVHEINNGGIRTPVAIKVKKQGEFFRVTDVRLSPAEQPAARPPPIPDDDDDLPF